MDAKASQKGTLTNITQKNILMLGSHISFLKNLIEKLIGHIKIYTSNELIIQIIEDLIKTLWEIINECKLKIHEMVLER